MTDIPEYGAEADTEYLLDADPEEETETPDDDSKHGKGD